MPHFSSARLTISCGAGVRMMVGSADTQISGCTTPISLSSVRELSSRSVMRSTEASMVFAAILRLAARLIGPMPQPYIMTLQPRFFAARSV